MLKTNFDINILYKFLSLNCDKYNDISNSYYIIDNITYKKIEYYEKLNDFIHSIEPFYINLYIVYDYYTLNYLYIKLRHFFQDH